MATHPPVPTVPKTLRCYDDFKTLLFENQSLVIGHRDKIKELIANKLPVIGSTDIRISKVDIEDLPDLYDELRTFIYDKKEAREKGHSIDEYL